MANAFYASPPSAPVPGPGAALPSAPVFAAEPIYNSLPGVAGAATAAVAEPQSRPAADADPGLGRGAAVGAGVRHRADAGSCAVLADAELRYSRKAASPAALHRLVPPVPTPSAPLPVGGSAAAPSPRGIPSDADLASLPFSLGGVMSLIPSFADAPSPYGPSGGLAGPAMGSAVPGDTYSFLDRSAAPAYDPSPRSGNGATPSAAAPGGLERGAAVCA